MYNRSCRSPGSAGGASRVDHHRTGFSYRNLIPLLIIFAFLSTKPVLALEDTVIVTLFKAHQPVNFLYIAGPVKVLKPAPQLLPAGLYQLLRSGGRFKLTALEQTGSTPIYFASQELKLAPLAGTFSLGVKSDSLRHYRGTLSITAAREQLVCRNQLSIKNYVSSVVGSETIAQFPEEALKAQSVLVQTAMLRYKANDELNDSTEKQAYLGAEFERPAVLRAVQNTWGKTLCFANRPLKIYFHAACGGGTSTSELFTGKSTGLPCDAAVPCKYCQQSPFWHITSKRVPANVFAAKFPEGLPTIMAKDKSSRPMRLKYPHSVIAESGYSFWLKVGQRLGWDKLPGTRFEIEKLAGGDIELRSTGAGHGVGMCQWGAAGMANEGLSYEKILTYYFPGSKLRDH